MGIKFIRLFSSGYRSELVSRGFDSVVISDCVCGVRLFGVLADI
jgi:hypothetical protein